MKKVVRAKPVDFNELKIKKSASDKRPTCFWSIAAVTNEQT